MKRSEALEIIKGNHGTIDTDTVAQQEFDLNDSAERILKALEDAGMLPPENSGGGCNDPNCCGGPRYEWDYE